MNICMPERTSAMTDLDDLIDLYLRWEMHDRPPIGYPSRASGTAQSRSSRQYQELHETSSEASDRFAIQCLQGAFDSLDMAHERAIRVDARNRECGAVVWRIPGCSAVETAGQIAAAKIVLRRLLTARGLYA